MTIAVLSLFRIVMVRRRKVSTAILLAVVFATAILAIPSTQAQTLTTLYSFSDTPDGAFPYGDLVRDAKGNLYGTTSSGGLLGYGTVFRLDHNRKETVLHSFAGSPSDGASPYAGLVRDPHGNLYGMTSGGGPSYAGTVFMLNPSGAETILHSFPGFTGDGASPFAGLVRDAEGNLYGTTYWGGQYAYGSVFKLDISGTETVLHSFGAISTHGTGPYSTLLRDASGNLFGTTQNSVSAGAGTVFSLNSSGHEKVLYRFTGGTDGAGPVAGVIGNAADGLYGTTGHGGDPGCDCGTVFKLDRTGTQTVLHRFTRGTDGAYPQAGVIRDLNGNLYGTTAFGGDTVCDCGMVFMLDIFGTETVLYRFTGGTDGSYPRSGLIRDAAGNLYGTTSNNGSGNFGTVFKLTP